MLYDNVRYIVFGGGGIHGFEFVGAVLAMESTLGEEVDAFYDVVEGYIGTSVGALMAMSLSIGVTGSVFQSLIKTIDWQRMKVGMNAQSIWEGFGMGTHDFLRYVVSTCLLKAGLSTHVTLAEVFRLTKKHFVCCVADISSSELLYLDHLNFPDLPMCDAVVASMCVPFLFEPCRIGELMCVDGGIVENMPVHYFPLEASIVFRVMDSTAPGKQVETWKEYAIAVLSCGHSVKEKLDYSNLTERDKARFVNIETPQQCPRSLDINMLNENTIALLVSTGFMQTISKSLPEFIPSVGKLVMIACAVHSTMQDNQ